MNKFYCVRVYPNGDAKDTLRDEAGKDSWVKYNLEARPGNFLFVNGEYIEGSGCYKPEPTQKIVDVVKPILLAELEKKLRGRMDTIGPQIDRTPFGSFTDYYTRYRPEPDRKPFNLRD